MDVRLPNGAVIKNVPDGTTRSQLIDKLRAGGYDVSEFEAKPEPQVTGEVGFLEDVYKAAAPAGKKLVNVAERLAISPEEFVGGIGQAIENIPESAVGLGAQGYALAEGALGLATPEGRAAALQGLKQVPYAVSQQINRAVMSPVEAIERGATFARRDPLGALAGVSAITGVPGALLAPGNALAQMSRVTNPLAIPELTAQMAARGVNRFVSPMFSERAAMPIAENQLLAAARDPQAVAAAMRTAPPVSVGAAPATATQRVAEQGLFEPRIAGLEESLRDIGTEHGIEIVRSHQVRLNAIDQQIQRVDQEIARQGAAVSPETSAQLRSVRDDLLRQRSSEAAAFTAQEQAVSQRLPATGQMAPGQAVSTRLREVRDRFRENVIDPAYTAAFTSAGNVTIPTRQIIQTAEDILGGRLADIPLGVATRTVRDLTRLERGATLRELDRVRKSINKDIQSAVTSGKNLNDLMELHSAIDNAVDASRIPMRAKIEYANALDLYRNEFVPRFRTGAAYDLIRTTKKNQSGILPSKTVSSFLSTEDAATQFARSFGDDAIARQAMTTGIQDLARAAAVDTTTMAVIPAKIDAFIAKNARQMEIMGIDPETLLAPVRQEAQRVFDARLAFEDYASKLTGPKAPKDASALVDQLLEDPALMDFTRRRLGEPAREALTKELTDRAIQMIGGKKPDDALKYLSGTPVSMVLDKSTINRLSGLAENQKLLQEIDAGKIEPAIKMDLALSNVPVDIQTDLRTAMQETARIRQAENMARFNVSPDAAKAYTQGSSQLQTAKEAVRGRLDVRATVMERIFGLIEKFANRKVAAILADALVNNPEKGAEMIERAMARQNAPKPVENRAKVGRRAAITGAITMQNAMPSENRNAMAR